jgi:hypothetical protein
VAAHFGNRHALDADLMQGFLHRFEAGRLDDSFNPHHRIRLLDHPSFDVWTCVLSSRGAALGLEIVSYFRVLRQVQALPWSFYKIRTKRGVEAGRYGFGAPKIAMRPSIINMSFLKKFAEIEKSLFGEE